MSNIADTIKNDVITAIKISGIVLDEIIAELHPRIGAIILKRWNFPADLQDVPLLYNQFDRSPAKADYSDLVMIATLQRVAGTDHPWAQMDWSTISAFERLGLDPEGSDDENLDAQMAAAMAMLQ
ncbi:hypothetical protein [Marinobacter gelidimuriae]|uniref:hypothetical protein n=1 Tax=Marinobacter gelidimuriae TaxID=2739064 RepID=UPI00035E5052|nr:hypothetical protein [Marinobacter gelidimuriae]